MEIAPGRSGASKPQHRFEKAPVILPGAAGVADFPGKQRRDPLPLRIAQDASIQGWPPFSSLESDFAQKGNPLCTYECQQALVYTTSSYRSPGGFGLRSERGGEYQDGDGQARAL